MSDQDLSGQDLRELEPPAPVAAEFVKLAQTLLDATTVQDVLDRVARAAQRVISGADVVGVSLRRDDGKLDTPASTDTVAKRLDDIQNTFDEGPCLDASRIPGTGTVFCTDVSTDGRFPRWGPAAAELGIGSVMAIGLFLNQAPPRIGALNIFCRSRSGLDEHERDMALVLAAHASTALAGVLATDRLQLEVAQLKKALRSRDVIGQAKGILMERRGVNQREAFDILRAASQSLNIKLAQVAETLTSRRCEL